MGHGVRESNCVGAECGVGSAGMGYTPKFTSLTSFSSASAVGLFSSPQKALFITINCVINSNN